MADHVYKPWEVPKGERWEYFLEYYKKPTIVAVLVVLALISILYTALFAPRPDVTLLTATYVHVDYTEWDNAAKAMEKMPFDYDGDGKSFVEFNVIEFSEAAQSGDPEAHFADQTRLAASIADAESVLQIVDADTIGYFEEQELLATYGELPWDCGESADTVIKIPLQELIPFRDAETMPAGLFLTVRPKELMHIGRDKKKLSAYENQLAMLKTMMEK